MKLAMLGLLALVPSTAHADCARSGLVPTVLTPSGTTVPGDGGIVVAAMENQSGKLDPGDAAIQGGWHLRVGNDTMKPPMVPIAPGLAVYRVAVANAYDAKLEDDKGAVVATVKPARRGGDALPAPKITKLWFEERRGRHGGAHVGVVLDGAVPAGVVAMVLADAKGVARSWVNTAGQTNLDPFHTSDCVALPNGTQPSKAGERVTLFWVGADGRVSAATKPLVIAPN